MHQALTCQLEVNYNPVTSDDDQTVTGKDLCIVLKLSQPYSVQFASSDDSFVSEEILIKNGKFIFTLPTGKKGTQYWIYVKDISGQLIASAPESIQYQSRRFDYGSPTPLFNRSVSNFAFPLTKDMRTLQRRWNFSSLKTVFLPLKEKKRFHTVADLKAGSFENGLPICIYEGESLITNRNTLVCHLAIMGRQYLKT